MKKRDERQEAIRQVIRSGSIKTQHALVASLNDAGIPCTQATISRDIADMNLVKAPDGSYMLAEDMKLRLMAADMVIGSERADNLVVVKTTSGTAQGVAAALDAADLPGTMGTIAGDDTILVIFKTAESAEVFDKELSAMVD